MLSDSEDDGNPFAGLLDTSSDEEKMTKNEKQHQNNSLQQRSLDSDKTEKTHHGQIVIENVHVEKRKEENNEFHRNGTSSGVSSPKKAASTLSKIAVSPSAFLPKKVVAGSSSPKRVRSPASSPASSPAQEKKSTGPNIIHRNRPPVIKPAGPSLNVRRNKRPAQSMFGQLKQSYLPSRIADDDLDAFFEKLDDGSELGKSAEKENKKSSLDVSDDELENAKTEIIPASDWQN